MRTAHGLALGNPYLAGIGGSAPAVAGALVFLSADWNPGVPDNLVDWGSEVYDVTNWHDTVTNTSRLVTPSGTALVRVISSVRSASIPQFQQYQNGAAFRGQGYRITQGGSTDNVMTMASAPIVVSAADYFELFGAVTITVNTRSWHAIEKLDASLKYVLVYKTTTPAISGGVTNIPFEAEVADVGGWHDNVTNNHRLTPPAGVTRVRVQSNVDLSSAGGVVFTRIWKNGANVNGGALVSQERGTDMQLNSCTAPMDITPGDWFSLQIDTAASRTLSSGSGTWMSAEEVPSYIKVVVAMKSANQAFTSGVEAAIQWDGADLIDDASMHDPTTNNTRLTVPAGMNYARLSFGLYIDPAAGSQELRVLKNGATFNGMASDNGTSATNFDALNAMGAWVPVTPGDYFETMLKTGANLNVIAAWCNWFCMECRP